MSLLQKSFIYDAMLLCRREVKGHFSEEDMWHISRREVGTLFTEKKDGIERASSLFLSLRPEILDENHTCQSQQDCRALKNGCIATCRRVYYPLCVWINVECIISKHVHHTSP